MLNMPTTLFDTPVRGFSTVTDREAFALERSSGANHYNRLDVVVRTAQGSWITDITGKKYLDCLAAYSAANLGHHHPKVVNAIMKALAGNYASVISNVVYTDPLALFYPGQLSLFPS
jgi:ornithine--oxo-acid transaminase